MFPRQVGNLYSGYFRRVPRPTLLTERPFLVVTRLTFTGSTHTRTHTHSEPLLVFFVWRRACKHFDRPPPRGSHSPADKPLDARVHVWKRGQITGGISLFIPPSKNLQRRSGVIYEQRVEIGASTLMWGNSCPVPLLITIEQRR